MAGLLLFITTYLILTYWFTYTAYRLFESALIGNGGFIEVLIALFNGFLALFMIKSLFISNKTDHSQQKEITPKDEPKLFKFLNDLADKTGAPRPNKVYLSNMVNASVFYDLKLWNLLFPSRKNLEIGIGLINVLNIGEFRAVLAHEFGHFAQRSMLLGRWVYVAHQIAAHIVAKRDRLDAFLSGLSRSDIRIAWIGWILSIIIWSIRSIVDMCFRVVVAAHSALSREMEFQADLVAVSVTGSDALIHALHKLRAADQGFADALNTANILLTEKKGIEDLYALQSNSIRQTARILNNPEYASSPLRPESDRASHRIFESKIAQPPQMWATHPADNDREDNAKRIYIDSEIAEGSSWELFQNPDNTKLELTARLIASAKVETTTITTDEALAKQNENYDHGYLDPKYRGVYLKQALSRHIKKPEDIYTHVFESKEEIKKGIEQLYPEALEKELEILSDINEELMMLNALKRKVLEAPGGVIAHRGQQIKRRQLPKVIESVEQERKTVRDKVLDHIEKSRSLHLEAAKHIENGWPEYHKSLVALIHFAEHSAANILDLFNVLNNVLYVVMADGRVTGSELRKVLETANNLRAAIKPVYDLVRNEKIKPGKEILQKLGIDSWDNSLEELGLPYADEQNINDWMNVVESWVFATNNHLEGLRNMAVETLLEAELAIAKHFFNDITDETAPEKSVVSTQYPILLIDQERPLEDQLSAWDKFMTAEGTLAAITRSAAALLLVGAAIALGAITNSTTEVYVYNGLDTHIEVTLNGEKLNVGPHGSQHTSVKKENQINVVTTTEDGGLIEKFAENIGNHKHDIVYNVANSSALVGWTVTYGAGYGSSDQNERRIGNTRWTTAEADYFFRDPPQSIKSSRKGLHTRDVLSGFSAMNPNSLLTYISKQQRTTIISHAAWDDEDSKYILDWMALARAIGIEDSILKARLERNPKELISLRESQELAKDEAKKEVCARQKELSELHPDNPDLYYLKCRCIEGNKKGFMAFVKGAARWPNHPWIAYANAYNYTKRADWEKALRYFKIASNNPALINVSEIETERIKRYLNQEKTVLEGYNSVSSDFLKFVYAAEKDESPELKNGPYYVYHHMYKGKLKEALRSASSPDVLWFIGASDGASDSIVDVIMHTPQDSGLDQNSIWSAAGLRLRQGKDVNVYYEQMNQYSYGLGDTLHTFIEKIKQGDFENAQVIIDKTPPWLKGQLCTLAVVAYGDRVPLVWKENAKKLLFCLERPYFN